MKTKILLLLAFLMVLTSTQVKSQDNDSAGYHFKMDIKLAATPVKNQYKSGTCWSFSGTSFLESELLRMGKGEYNLSEMFVVRNIYSDKAVKYVRMQGNISFGAGGEFNDVVNVYKNYGAVPEDIYSGKNIGLENHVHNEMDEVLKDYMEGVIKNPNGTLTPVWHNGFLGILDSYLGAYPNTFTWQGKSYTPQTFEASLGLNLNDYILVSSFTHHPFYDKFILEVPDNWSWGYVYNVPLDELIAIVDHSLQMGYTVAWAADVSEKGFSFKKGLAVVPYADTIKMTEAEKTAWNKMTVEEKDEKLYSLDKPGEELKITQDMRQKGFDDYDTQDDHGMHIIGIAHDQNGTKYYYVKNSWGTHNPYNGYIYVSETYLKYKTTSIMINKNSLTNEMAKKLELK